MYVSFNIFPAAPFHAVSSLGVRHAVCVPGTRRWFQANSCSVFVSAAFSLCVQSFPCLLSSACQHRLALNPLFKSGLIFFSSTLRGWQSCALEIEPGGFQIECLQTEGPLCHQDVTLAELSDFCLECPYQAESLGWSVAASKLLPLPLVLEEGAMSAKVGCVGRGTNLGALQEPSGCRGGPADPPASPGHVLSTRMRPLGVRATD